MKVYYVSNSLFYLFHLIHFSQQASKVDAIVLVPYIGPGKLRKTEQGNC